MDLNDKPRYVRVNMGIFGLRSGLIPEQLVAADTRRRVLMLRQRCSWRGHVLQGAPAAGSQHHVRQRTTRENTREGRSMSTALRAILLASDDPADAAVALRLSGSIVRPREG